MRGGSSLAAAVAVVGLMIGVTFIARTGRVDLDHAVALGRPTAASAQPDIRGATLTPTPQPSSRPIDARAAARLTPVVQQLMRSARPRAEFLASGYVAGPFVVYLDPAGYLVASANVRDATGTGYVGLTIGWSELVDPFEPCGQKPGLRCDDLPAPPGYRVAVVSRPDDLTLMVGATAPDGTALLAYAGRYAVDSREISSAAHRPAPALTVAQMAAILTDPRLRLVSG
jgi:hypothetical protein